MFLLFFWAFLVSLWATWSLFDTEASSRVYLRSKWSLENRQCCWSWQRPDGAWIRAYLYTSSQWLFWESINLHPSNSVRGRNSAVIFCKNDFYLPLSRGFLLNFFNHSFFLTTSFSHCLHLCMCFEFLVIIINIMIKYVLASSQALMHKVYSSIAFKMYINISMSIERRDVSKKVHRQSIRITAESSALKFQQIIVCFSPSYVVSLIESSQFVFWHSRSRVLVYSCGKLALMHTLYRPS